MTDDLVKRLRETGGGRGFPWQVMEEAADEIERLGVQNKNLRQRLKNNKEVADAEIERLQEENEGLKKRLDRWEPKFEYGPPGRVTYTVND